MVLRPIGVLHHGESVKMVYVRSECSLDSAASVRCVIEQPSMEAGAANRSSCVHLGRHLVGMHGFIWNFCILVYTGDFLPLASANSFFLGNTPFQYCLASI